MYKRVSNHRLGVIAVKSHYGVKGSAPNTSCTKFIWIKAGRNEIFIVSYQSTCYIFLMCFKNPTSNKVGYVMLNFSQFKDFQTFLSRNPNGRPPCRWTAAGASSGTHRQCWGASTPGVAKLHLHELHSFTVTSRIQSRNLSMLEQPIGIRAGKQRKIKMIKIHISSVSKSVQLFEDRTQTRKVVATGPATPPLETVCVHNSHRSKHENFENFQPTWHCCKSCNPANDKVHRLLG